MNIFFSFTIGEGDALFSGRLLGLMRAISFWSEKYSLDHLQDHLHVHLQDHLHVHLHILLITIANHHMQISMSTDKTCMHPPLTHPLMLFGFKI
jgi:hypothetical protein